jgi:RNase H-fold protein (predicted Holliday junction resolvase)
LREASGSRTSNRAARKKAARDAVAAAVILEGWLESRRTQKQRDSETAKR